MIIALPQLATAMGCALILLAAIIGIANCVHWFGRKQTAQREAEKKNDQSFNWKDLIVPPRQFILLRVLLDENDHASLSSFQFLAWTLVIAFLYLTLWVLRFLNGTSAAPPDIPANLMVLMGISIAVPVASKGIEIYKTIKPRLRGETYQPPDYASMLEENGSPSLLRFQMFFWTLAALVIYVVSFVIAALGQSTDILTTGLPDINPTFLFLMGMSQAGYLGSKAVAGKVEKTGSDQGSPVRGQPAEAGAPAPATQSDGQKVPMAIREIVPRDSVRSKDLVTILGSGFGVKPDTLMIGDVRIDPAGIARWEDGRIEFSLPEKTALGMQPVRILTGTGSASGQVTVSGSPWLAGGLDNVDAEIISDIWIDDPTMKGYKCPPIGHFIPDKRYYFFFEFAVPPGTPSWGLTQFRARFLIDGQKIDENSFLPGYMNGRNYGVFNHIFKEQKTFRVEIQGLTSKVMDVVVKNPGQK